MQYYQFCDKDFLLQNLSFICDHFLLLSRKTIDSVSITIISGQLQYFYKLLSQDKYLLAFKFEKILKSSLFCYCDDMVIILFITCHPDPTC